MVERVTREEPSARPHRDYGVEADRAPATKADIGHALHELREIRTLLEAVVGQLTRIANTLAKSEATDQRVEALEHTVDLALKVDTLRRGEPHRRRLAWVGVIVAAASAAATALASLFSKHR